jgi:hypothetical protein
MPIVILLPLFYFILPILQEFQVFFCDTITPEATFYVTKEVTRVRYVVIFQFATMPPLNEACVIFRQYYEEVSSVIGVQANEFWFLVNQVY